MSLDHHFEEPTAIRTNLGAIFVSLELSRSTWLIVASLSPGGGEKMSKHGVSAGNIAALLIRLTHRGGRMAGPRAVSASACPNASLPNFFAGCRISRQRGVFLRPRSCFLGPPRKPARARPAEKTGSCSASPRKTGS